MHGFSGIRIETGPFRIATYDSSRIAAPTEAASAWFPLPRGVRTTKLKSVPEEHAGNARSTPYATG